MHTRRAVPVLAALGLALAGCGSGEVLVPVARFADGAASATIGAETRPVLQAYPQTLLFQRPAFRVPANGRAELVVRVPRELADDAELVVEPQLRSGGSSLRLEARRLPVAADGTIHLQLDELPLQDQVHLYGLARRPVAPQTRHATPPTEIPSGAELDFGMGIAAIADAQGPVRFRVRACDTECETLFEEDLRPGGGRWHERRLPLQSIAGRTVSFRFETEHQRDAPGAFTFALWAAPTLFAPAARERPDLLLISIDTLRADHLPTYGYARDTAPFVDAELARPGVVFEQAVTAATTTGPSHMTMFTSLQPSVHQILPTTHAVLPASVPTLAEVLRAHGYATGAFTENAAIDAPRGFVRGFDTYREIVDVERTPGHVERTLGDGLEWLERNRGRPTFLFLHTYQVHTPYQPPQAYTELFAGDGQWADPRLNRRQEWHPNHYDREIRYTDDSLADFFGRARAAGLLHDTIVVFTSDHGEAFLEHGLYAHGPVIHQEVLRVPLLFSGPGIPRGRRVATPVGLIDLMPTLLELAHVPAPPGLMGKSFAGLLHGNGDASEFASRPIISEAWREVGFTATGGVNLEVPIFSVRRGDRKLVRWPEGSDFRFAYYDLANDPGEQNDLYDAEEPDAVSLRELLQGYPDQMAALQQSRVAGELQTEVQPDPERTQKLRALGYVE